ncbi:MAG: A24 family peptidase [Acidimicrobiia bacterium]|nr:A24 family peptidase [Acidimicrobiia bacterium]
MSPWGLLLAAAFAVAAGPPLAATSRVLAHRWPVGVELRSAWRAVDGRGFVFSGLCCSGALLGAWRWGVGVTLLPFFLLVAVLVLMAAVDLDTKLIPDRLNAAALGFALPLLAVAAGLGGDWRRFGWALAGAAAMVLILGLAHAVHPAGLGFGDVKLAPLLGAYLGFAAHSVPDVASRTLGALFAASLSGSVVGVALWIRHRRAEPFAFGPFLALGTLTVLLLSPPLL